jgi:hypothetical protein
MARGIPRNTYFDYDRRMSTHPLDKLGGLDWTYSLVSEDGAHYHCWIPSGITAEEQKEVLTKFQKAARQKGDPVCFSYDYLPKEKI